MLLAVRKEDHKRINITTKEKEEKNEKKLKNMKMLI